MSGIDSPKCFSSHYVNNMHLTYRDHFRFKLLCAVSLTFMACTMNVLGQDSDKADSNIKQLHQQRINLQQKMQKLWVNGNVKAALEVGPSLLAVEKTLFGSDHQRVAERNAQLCGYAVELKRDAEALQFLAESTRIYRTGTSPESWEQTEALRLETITRILLERPLSERQELYGWQRQFQQATEARDAIRLLEAAENYARICRDYFGDRHPHAIMAMAFVQNTEVALGRFELAATQLKRLQVELQQVEHPEHPNHAIFQFIRANLAASVGDIDESLRAATASVEGFQQSGMNYAVDYMTSLTLQGALFITRGEFQQSLKPLRAAYKIGQVEGTTQDRLRTTADQLCMSLKQVARKEWDLQNWKIADELMDEAYRISVEQWGEDNFRSVEIRIDPIMTSDPEAWSVEQRETYDQTKSLLQQMNMLSQSGKAEEAVEIAKQRYEKLVELFGRTNAATLRARFDVLWLMTDPSILGKQDQQKLISQITEYLRVLSVEFGTTHWEYASACFQFSQRFGASSPRRHELTLKALDGYRESLTKDSDQYVETLTVLGCILEDDRGVEYLNEAIELWESRPSRGSYAHCQAVASLGALHHNLDNHYEARHLLAEAAKMLRAHEKENVAFDLAVVLNYLGNIASYHGRTADALQYYTEANSLFETGTMNARAHTFGKILNDYINTYEWCLFNAANACESLGQFAEGEKLITRLLDRFPQNSTNERYRNALYAQATLLAHQDHVAEATEALSKASSIVDEFYATDPLVRGHHSLMKAKVALILKEEAKTREFLDGAFEEFQKIDDLNKIERFEWGYFDTYLLRLREHYAQLHAWDQVVAVREFAQSSEAIIYEDWPNLLTTLKQELELDRQVAALTQDDLRSYEQLLADTKTLSDADGSEVDSELLERSSQLIKTISEAFGPFNLTVMKYAQAAAKYFEEQEEYDNAFESISLAVSIGAVRLGEEHPDMLPMAIQLSRLLRFIGKYREAKELAEVCVRNADEIQGEESLDTFTARFELAKIYSEIQDHSSALPLARSASEGFRRLWGEQNREYAEALRLMGDIYYGIGEPVLAHSEILSSNEIIHQLKDASDRDRLRSSVAVAVSTASDDSREEEARERFKTVIAAYQEANLTKTEKFQSLLIQFGDALLRWNDEEAAAKNLEQAVAGLNAGSSNPTLKHIALQKLGIAQRRTGDFEAAGKTLAEAIEIQEIIFGKDSTVIAESQFQLAIVEHLLGRDSDALLHVEQCLQLQQQHLTKIGRLLSDSSLTMLLDEEEKPLDLLISTINLEEPTLAELRKAFEWSTRRKGLALDLTCRMKALEQSQSFDSVTLGLMNEIRMQNQELADLTLRPQGDLSEQGLADQRRELQRNISITQGKLDEQLRKGKVATIEFDAGVDEIVSTLKVDEAFIEYLKVNRFVADPQERPIFGYVAFCVYKNEDDLIINFADLGDAKIIDDLIEQLREQTGRLPRALRLSTEADLEESYREFAQQLHEHLLGPFGDDLASVDSLIISPDAGISTVPFAALVNGEGRYLVESKNLSYVSSIRDLLRGNQPPGSGTLVISNPNFDAEMEQREESLSQTRQHESTRPLLALRGGDIELRTLRWARLPGAEDEAKDISSILGLTDLGPVTSYLGDDAAEEVFKSAHSARIVHLATHGFYFPAMEYDEFGRGFASSTSNRSRLRSADNPLLRSGIVLAGANRSSSTEKGEQVLEDGWVTAQEIARMDFRNTELIVLSACESGLGDVSSGQGVQGIRRSFLNAGAHSVLTTLFKVPDGETRELIKSFYEQLVINSNRRTALCEAQRKQIEARRAEHQAAHPFFWASFVLFGDVE